MEDKLKSKDGYSCPNCGAIHDTTTLLSQTKPEFHEEPDPHYKWVESHKCQKCETIYLLNNGT